jgi:two-component system chemotaxis response regulator CheY
MVDDGGTEPQRRVRTLIIDDDEDMRMLTASIIRVANKGLEVVGTAADGESGLEQWRELRPDVVVVDHRMPGTSGLDVAEQMLTEEPAQSIVLFSAYLDDVVTDAAEQIGICSILEKDRFNDLPSVLWSCAST